MDFAAFPSRLTAIMMEIIKVVIITRSAKYKSTIQTHFQHVYDVNTKIFTASVSSRIRIFDN